MTVKEKLVWTVLPYGFDKHGKLKVSIVISPRLTPLVDSDQWLSGYDDFKNGWPNTLAGIRFELDIDGVPYPLDPLDKPDNNTWLRIFPPDKTWVEGFTYTDLSRHNLRSFPVRHLVRFIKDYYGDLARSNGIERPPLFPLSESPLAPMIEAAAGGDLGRQDKRQDPEGLPAGAAHLLVGGRVDQAVDRNYFGEDSRHAPESIRGIDGKPVSNKKGYRTRALPADLPSDLDAQFGSSPAAYSLYQANRFYSRPEARQPPTDHPDPKAGKLVIKTPEFDFHKLVASFADAPSMMRRLGLVIDAVIVDSEKLLASLPSSGTGTMTLQVKRHKKNDPTVEDHTPRTAWQLKAKRFIPQARPGGDHQDGLLALGGAGEVLRSAELKELKEEPGIFNLVQVDPDGSAHKLVNFTNSMLTHIQKVADPDHAFAASLPGKLTYTTNGNQETTPALRSGGITVIRHGRAAELAKDLIANDLKNNALGTLANSDNMLLYADDVLRGYRVDVRPSNVSDWQSLCQRVVSYRYAEEAENIFSPDEEKNQVHDEGYVRGASTTTQASPEAVDGNHGIQDHYLHESMFKWTGWSLVAPRPGHRIVAVNEHGLIQEEVVKSVDEKQDRAIGAGKILTTVRAEPGSLPRLRFNTGYRLRARLVDMAGNSLSMGEPDKLEEASNEIVYRRLEPLDPPVLALKQRLSEGESLERVVIRSDVSEPAKGLYEPLPAAKYLQQSPYGANDPGVTGFAYQDINLRHVVPPKTSQIMAEQHGQFDKIMFDLTRTASGAMAINATYELIAKLESGTLYDGGSSVHLITPASNGISTEEKLDPPPAEGFRLQPGQYVIHTEELLPTPYLPDPLAAAVVLRGVPGVEEEFPLDKDGGVFAAYIPGTEELALYIPFSTTKAGGSDAWPDVPGLRIAIAEAEEKIDAANLMDDYEGSKAIPQWDADTRTLTIFLRKGEIAPIRYSCAVRPDRIDELALPDWSGAGWSSSVARLATFGAHWMMTPDRTLTLVHATQHPVCPPVFRQLNQERPDGATYADFGRETLVAYHARSTGQLEVLAEWMEWDDSGPDKPVRRKLRARLKEVHIEQPPVGTPDPVQSDFAQLGISETDGVRAHLRHEFGDHKFRFVRYRLIATSRFREYLPPSLAIEEEDTTRLGPEWLHDCLGLPASYYDEKLDGATNADCGAPLLSASGTPQGQIVRASNRPQAPKVIYQIPAQNWKSSESGQTHSIIRQGNILRVYLERPWFSSGEGELLGVIVAAADGSQTKLAELASQPALEQLVSQWGLDPLFDSAHPKPAITAAAFPEAVCTLTATLPEAGRQVTVVGHRVHFDAQRHQWFADLRVEAGNSYMPFVRLCLIRLQPHANDLATLSPPVQAPFASLLPNRHIEWRDIGDGLFDFRVYGPAPTVGAASGEGYLAGWLAKYQTLFALDGGRNRIELVVQAQTSAFDTDLDWFDVDQVPKASGDAVPHQQASGIMQFAADTTPVTTFKQQSAAFGYGSATAAQLNPELIRQWRAFEDCIWEGRILVPEAYRKGRVRLVLREYERHFSDDLVKVQPFELTRNQIVERLVFAREFYVLGYQPDP